MKTRKIDLNVDFIGGQGSLTIEEEKALSNFFQQRKSVNKASIKSKGAGRPKTTAWLKSTGDNISFKLRPGEVVVVVLCFLFTLVLGRQWSAFYSGTI